MKRMISSYNRFLRLVSIIPTVLALFLIVNNIVFIHSHTTATGRIWTHAHPYNKNCDSTPFKQHHHSDYDYQFLQQLQEPIPLANPLTLQADVLITFQQYARYETAKAQNNISFRIIGRAPPTI